LLVFSQEFEIEGEGLEKEERKSHGRARAQARAPETWTGQSERFLTLEWVIDSRSIGRKEKAIG